MSRRAWVLPIVLMLTLGPLTAYSMVELLRAPRVGPATVAAALGSLLVCVVVVGVVTLWLSRLNKILLSAEMRRVVEGIDRLPHGPVAPDLIAAARALSSSVESLLLKEEATRSRLLPDLGDQDPLDSRYSTIRNISPIVPALTRSAIFDGTSDPLSSQEFAANACDMIGRLEPHGLKWIDSTAAEQEFLGWPLATLRTLSFPDVVHPDHRELAREQLRAAIAKGEAHGLIYRIRTARGESKAIEVNVGVRYTAAGTVDHLRCHITDVTEKLRASRELRRRTRELLAANGQLVVANRALQEMKDRYSDLYQNAPAMYFSLDESGVIRECNDTLLTTLGFDRESVIGRPYVTMVPEWRRPAFAAHFAQFLSTGRIDVESQWLTADGRSIDVHITGSAVFGPNGEIVRSRSLARDITARKILESKLQENNAQLAQAVEDLARKNQELDDFSYSVSHDLQEPLRTLISFSGLLVSDYSNRLDGEGREHLRYVLEASTRMRALVKDLLALSRSGRAAGGFARIDLGEILAEVRNDHAAMIAAKSGELVIAPNLPPVWGDRDRIARLIGNLVSNGLKYHKPGDRPRVEVSATAEPDGSVTIAVKDRGIGIDPKFHERVFGLFRRLHARDEYEGTGAGLAICRKIAVAHGGQIAIDSEVGAGATFTVHLPGPPATDQ